MIQPTVARPSLRNFCIENYKTILGMVVAGFFTVFLFDEPDSLGTYRFYMEWALSVVLWITLWVGNSFSSGLLSSYISWIKYPVRRLLIGIGVMLVYSIADILLVRWLFGLMLRPGYEWNLLPMLASSLIITVVVSMFMHGLEFFRSWQSAALSAEKAKQESIRAQYDSLRSQVNPHFLFNSLNALTNLVYEDQDRAAKFIKQLSEVYRYVLDTQPREVVSLQEELAFLKSYLFLQQIRFGDKLQVSVELDHVQSDVAPLVLQILVENAIKHNTISTAYPLHIRLGVEDGYLVVSNNRQQRQVLPGDSTGLGLANIIRRYEFISSRPVVVEQSEQQFTVRIPVIQPHTP
ncbi:MAG: histidine kinase [Cyclobacteriaceae bacterium]|nr:histidine kinase [Cyclobacteriaceae bacterium]